MAFAIRTGAFFAVEKDDFSSSFVQTLTKSAQTGHPYARISNGPSRMKRSTFGLVKLHRARRVKTTPSSSPYASSCENVLQQEMGISGAQFLHISNTTGYDPQRPFPPQSATTYPPFPEPSSHVPVIGACRDQRVDQTGICGALAVPGILPRCRRG